MKKIATLCLTLLVTVATFGQTQNQSFTEAQHNRHVKDKPEKFFRPHVNPNAQHQQVRKTQTALEKLEAIISYDTLVNGTRMPVYKIEYAYDANGLDTLYTVYLYENGQWVKDYEDKYEYNSNNQVIKHTRSSRDNNVWSLGSETETTYDANGKIVEYLNKDWVNGAWQNYSKTTYSYINGQLDERIRSDWSNNTWGIIGKTEYNYDSNGNLTEGLHYFYPGNGSWELSGKQENQYNSNNLPTQSIHYFFNTTTQGWDPYYKDEQSYNANNVVSNYKSYDYTNGTWVKGYERTNTYDANGNIQNTEYASYTNGSVNWKDRSEYIFDVNVLASDIYYAHDFFVPEEWMTNKLIGVKSFEEVAGNWVAYDDSVYFKYTSAIGQVEEQMLAARVYPNPAKSYIKIELPTVDFAEATLYDITGKALISTKLEEAHSKLDVSQLSHGMYILTINSNAGSHIQKIIVE